MSRDLTSGSRDATPMHLLLTLPLAVGSLLVQDARNDEAVLALGRELTEAFYAGEIEPIWDGASEELRAVFGDADALFAFHEQLVAEVGEEVEVVTESTSRIGGNDHYVRRARFAKTGTGTFDVTWAFDAERVILGFQIRPTQVEAKTRFLDYETKTPLRLPFEDPWDVFWGGRTLPQNYHTAYPDQRFAYDFLVIEDGSTHTGSGERNEDYHCFGLRILSPAAGTVVSAADDVVDNVPGEMNPRQALGNHVILDHGNGEYSFLAHFQQGSVQVEQGDEVEAGQWLGFAGNSGNTSEPHLHYHLQTTPDFNAGEGLPAQFQGYVADDEPVARGEPVKGQRIRPR